MGLIKKNQIEERGTLLLEKQEAPPPMLQPKIKSSLSAGLPVKEQIVQAKSEAQKILDKAGQEAESIKEDARQIGREEGRNEAAGNIEESMKTLNQAVQERKKIIKDSENEILKLATKIAEQIIRSEVSLHRDVCLNIVAEAIARVSDREQIIVRVNREDAEYLKRYKDRLARMLDGVKSFSILEDAGIEPGGCIIETNLGFIDAKIATKLKSLEEALDKVASDESNQNAD